MKISNNSAQQIVEEIGELVRQNINLMDATGHIIASNDPTRIGNFHPGAFEIITQHKKELYITRERELADPLVRQGINLPIEVEGQVQGVIGITGLYDEVIQYGQIVKKMAEILVKERIVLDEQRLDQRIRTRFLEEWIMGDGLANLQNLSERGFSLGIDISIPRRCVVVSPRHLKGYLGSLEGQEFLEQVESVVTAHLPQGSIVLRNTGRQILVLPRRSNRELMKLCRRLTAAVSDRLDVQLVCGIDGSASDIHTACLQANRAWRFANHAAQGIVEFDSLHAELVLVIGMGVLCSIFPLIAGLIYAKFIGKKVKSADELATAEGVTKTYEELVAEYGKLPGGFNALAPIIIPVILMALGTIGKQIGITGIALNILNFLGTPIISLAVGTIFAIAQLAIAKKMDQFYNITNETLKTVGPILFVTAAGGVLGKVISSTTMVSYITENANFLMNLGIFFPFLLAAILKTAQGSSTVAITTTAGIMAPMMESLGLGTPVLAALTVMAIGAGAMTVSHANDSYFWVVTNFGDMTPDQGYKTQTVLTLVMGIASIIGIFIVSLFF